MSEVDLRRNDYNSDIFATNNLTTEQLHQKLQIQGYKIFLRRSLPLDQQIHFKNYDFEINL